MSDSRRIYRRPRRRAETEPQHGILIILLVGLAISTALVRTGRLPDARTTFDPPAAFAHPLARVHQATLASRDEAHSENAGRTYHR
jgi:hypothetical protein